MSFSDASGVHVKVGYAGPNQGSLRVLVLTHEQRRHYTMEPGYYELVLPLLQLQGLGRIDMRVYPYQRLVPLVGRSPAIPVSSLRSLARRVTRRASVVAAEDWLWTKDCTTTLFRDLRELTTAWRPDLVINLATWWHQSLNPDDIVQLTQMTDRVVTVLFDHDETNPDVLSWESGVIACSDRVICADSPTRVDRIRLRQGTYRGWVGTEKVIFAPLPVDTRVFWPSSKVNRVALLGSLEGYRREVLDELLQEGYPIHSGGSLLDNSRFLEWENYGQQLRESLANIVTQTQPSRSQLKGRSWQTLASGSYLMEQRTEDATILLEPLGVRTWGSTEELRTLIDLVLTSPDQSLREAQELRDAVITSLQPEAFLAKCLG